MMKLRTVLAVVIASTVALTIEDLNACPFCSPVSQTFSEEISMMDVVTIAQLQQAGDVSKLNTNNPQAEVPKSVFVITKVIKGEEFIKVGDTFETIYFGDSKKDRPFLAMATDAPQLIWSTPLILSSRAEEYLDNLKSVNGMHTLEIANLETESKRLGTQPDNPDAVTKKTVVDAKLAKLKLETNVNRLRFFQAYLEDTDEMLARDAYDEFAKAPYAEVIALKEQMNRPRLLEFIQNPDVPSNRRRLYFTMLGVCGQAEDAELLETLMKSDDRKQKAGLDALLACYIILTGEEGLAKVDSLFLMNKKAEYADTYAAIMAIRFHGAETDVVPRKRLVKSLRYMLERPELADLVIPDLARWEDWEVMPTLVDLFVNADENSSWVRVPVINFLRACPLPEAAQKIEELKEIDPDSVKRAMQFFPLPVDEKEKVEEPKPADAASAVETVVPVQDIDAGASSDPQPEITYEEYEQQQLAANRGEQDMLSQPLPPQPITDAEELVSKVSLPGGGDERVAENTATVLSPDKVRANQTESLTSIDTPDTLNEVEAERQSGVNIWTLLGVTLVGGCLCFVTMRSILGVGVS